MYLPESISSSDTPRYSSGMSNSMSECSAEFNQINIEQGDKGQSVIIFWIIYKINRTMIGWKDFRRTSDVYTVYI